MRLRTIRSLLITIINTFFITFRPLLGPRGVCIFQVTCLRYTCQQLETQPLLTAVKNIIKRISRCQPFTT